MTCAGAASGPQSGISRFNLWPISGRLFASPSNVGGRDLLGR